MTAAILAGIVANLLVLVGNVGACFYWAGSVRATLFGLDQRLRAVEAELIRAREQLDA